MQVHVNPAVLRWARERASLSPEALASKMNLRLDLLSQWEQTGELTLAHVERIAEKTHTPLGYLFLQYPPDEAMPIPDFRTIPKGQSARPSPDLVDTIYLCQRRQDWFRSFLIEEGEQPLSFVGTANIHQAVVGLAESIRSVIGLDLGARSTLASWEEALRDMVERVEGAGVLVMRNGVVENNTYRKLRVDEFRGFVLVDTYAPVIFINAADSRSAQMFTLAHELAHIWLGQSAVSDVRINTSNATERFCNQVAAELLVPMRDFAARWQKQTDVQIEVQRLARHYKVSNLVLLIRARDAEFVDQVVFEQLYAQERERGRDGNGSGGGDFYRTQRSRIGKRFARAIITRALEGHTLYRDALGLLGLKKMETFHKLARAFEVTGE